MPTSELIEKLSFWQYWQGVAALAVAIGLVFEVGLVKLARFSSKAEKNQKRFEHWVGEIGAIMVAVGVIAEWRCGQRVTFLASELERDSENSVAAAMDKASVATTQASSANVQLAILASKTSPRALTAEQYAALRDRFMPLAGKSVDIISCGAGPEGDRFADQLSKCCSDAKILSHVWTVADPGFRAPSGIGIGTEHATELSTQPNEIGLARETLETALISQGFSVWDIWPPFSREAMYPADNLYGLKIVGMSLYGPWGIAPTTWDVTKCAPIRIIIGPRN